MYIYVYMYTHTNMCIYINVHMYMDIYTHKQTNIRAYACSAHIICVGTILAYLSCISMHANFVTFRSA